jgi:hypothetical protein
MHGSTGQLPGGPGPYGPHANPYMLCTACFLNVQTLIWLLGRKFILFGLKKVQLGAMTLLFSSFLFIISKFYISTIIVKIQMNDNKFKNINLLFTTQYILLSFLSTEWGEMAILIQI